MEQLQNFCLNSVAILLLLTACQSKEQRYKRSFTEIEKVQFAEQLSNGSAYHYQGSPANQILLRKGLEYAPNDADLIRELGVPYLKRGIISAFPNYYGKSGDLDPLKWQAWRGYLYLYFHRDYERAIQDFDAADPLTPNFVDYPQAMSIDYMRGIAYLMLENHEHALHYFDKHFAYESEEVGVKYMENVAFLFKGITHYKMGDLDEALEILNLGLSHNPRSPDLLFWKAKILVAQGGEATEIRAILADAKQYFYSRNTRNYVEEFYELYPSDLEELETQLGEG